MEKKVPRLKLFGTPRAAPEAECIFGNVSLERIADCQVDAHSVFKVRDIVIAFLSGIVREMQTDTHVETDDDKGEVVTQAEAGSQG